MTYAWSWGQQFQNQTQNEVALSTIITNGQIISLCVYPHLHDPHLSSFYLYIGIIRSNQPFINGTSKVHSIAAQIQTEEIK